MTSSGQSLPRPGLGDGSGVGQHADGALHLGQVASRHHCWWLVVDADLEKSNKQQLNTFTVSQCNCSKKKFTSFLYNLSSQDKQTLCRLQQTLVSKIFYDLRTRQYILSCLFFTYSVQSISVLCRTTPRVCRRLCANTKTRNRHNKVLFSKNSVRQWELALYLRRSQPVVYVFDAVLEKLTLNPVGHQSTNWIVLFVLIVAIAAFTSLGTTSPLLGNANVCS